MTTCLYVIYQLLCEFRLDLFLKEQRLHVNFLSQGHNIDVTLNYGSHLSRRNPLPPNSRRSPERENRH